MIDEDELLDELIRLLRKYTEESDNPNLSTEKQEEGSALDEF